jgi:hypothetical protein
MTSVLVPFGIVVLVAGYFLSIWSCHIDALSPDAIDYASVARNLAEGAGYRLDLIPFHPGFLPTVSHLPEWHGLLRPFELAPFFAVFGAQDAWVKAPSLLYICGTAILAYVLGRRLSGQAAGCLATLLILMRADIAFLAGLGFDDPGAAFWSLLTLYCACRVPSSPSARWAVATGFAAAFGTLEKFTDVLLPFAVVGAIFVRKAERANVGVRKCLLILAPSICAAALYFLRNYWVWGAFDFRFSALEWLGKDNMANYFAYYPTRPTIWSVWRDLGVSGVLHGIGLELRGLSRMALENWPVMFGGPLALGIVASRQPLFALSGLFDGLLLVGSICVGHQFEPRYILSLVCIEIVALAVVAIDATQRLIARFPLRWRPPVRATLALAVGGFLVGVPIRGILKVRERGGELPVDRGCPDAFEFIRLHVEPASPILAVNPWSTVWDLHRPAVIAPTNGADALELVARHYGTQWAFVKGSDYLGADLRRLAERGSSVRPLLVAESEDCRVYWLRP